MGKESLAIAKLPKSFTKADLLDFIIETARATAKETADAIEKANRRNARRSDPGKIAQRMLSDYRRLKLAQKEDLVITEDEAREMRYDYLVDLMGTLDRNIITEDVIYAKEKKRQYNQYKIQRIEAAAALYRKECEESGSEEALRRCRIVWMRYLDEDILSVEEIAVKESVSKNTVYHDIDLACKTIAVYLSAL